MQVKLMVGTRLQKIRASDYRMVMTRMKSKNSDQASDSSRDLIHPCLEQVDRFNLSEAWNLPIIVLTVSLLCCCIETKLSGDKALRKTILYV